MAAPIISTMSPVVLNSTVLAQADSSFDPSIAREVFRHSGNPYGSAIVKTGAAPAMRFRTPFLPAFNLLGFKLTKLTAFEFYFARFLDFQKQTGAVHTRLKLNTGAVAAARITGASVGYRGILMAEVDVVPLSTDGMTHPLVSDTAALPTLSAQPALHTLGPCQVNGARITGVSNQGFDLGISMSGEPADGDLYLRTVAEIESNPTLAIEHADPITVLSALGLFGTPVASTTRLFFRDIHATTGASLDTALSLALTAGTVDPSGCRLTRGSANSIGMTVQPLSSDTTHPLTLTTGVTVPAA